MTDDQSRPRKIHPEMLVGVSAVVIGLCALGVSLYETSLMRQEQRASVIPLLELGRSFNVPREPKPDQEPRFWLTAENVGIGPARVQDFQVTVDGEPQPTWGAAMLALTGREARITYAQSTINGRTIPPERQVQMLQISDRALILEIMAEFDRLDFEACFCSIFNECWTTRYSTFGSAQPVESCQRGEVSFAE